MGAGLVNAPGLAPWKNTVAVGKGSIASAMAADIMEPEMAAAAADVGRQFFISGHVFHL